MGTTLEYEKVKVIPPMPVGSTFDAECVEAKVIERNNRDKTETYNKVSFKFVVSDPDGDYDTQNVWGETSTNFNNHPDCRLSNWAKALLGVDEFPVGYTLDLDHLGGNRARIVTGQREYEKDNVPKVHVFVADVIPVGGLAFDGEEPF